MMNFKSEFSLIDFHELKKFKKNLNMTTSFDLKSQLKMNS